MNEIEREARRAGLSLPGYLEQASRGLLFCRRCQDFHPEDRFGVNRARGNLKAGSCLRSLTEARKQLRYAARQVRA